MKLAYVTARMPFAYAEQFFEPEIDSLAATFDVTVIPTRATRSENRYPHLAATPHYLGLLDRNVARLAWTELRRSPRGALAALRTVAFGRCALRARAVNLLLFPKALALATELRRLGIEHVHVNWMTSSATIVYVASRLTGIPFSITAHQHDIFYDNLVREKVGLATFVRVISARNCRHLQDLLPPELRAKCYVVHLGVRLPSAPLAPPERLPRILCAARMCEWKGHRFLLRALAELRDAGVAFSCDLAGDGEIEGDVAKLLADLRLGDRVKMLGNVPHAELVTSLERGAYDIFALASTERNGEHEGIPVALMEAMAVRMPVVATRTGSIEELVDDRSGILVPQADPPALARALERLLGDPTLRRTLGEHGRKRVLAEFSTERTTAELSELLLASAPWCKQRDQAPDEGQKSYVKADETLCNPDFISYPGVSNETICGSGLSRSLRQLRRRAHGVVRADGVARARTSGSERSRKLDGGPRGGARPATTSRTRTASRFELPLRPGDEVSLTVYGEAALSPAQPLRVLPGGAVEVPLVGEVIVGGKTPAEASSLIARKLQRYLKEPRVTLAVFNVAPVESLVLGNVKTPGKYTLLPPARLTDVIAAAGGLGPTDGDLPDARVQSASGAITTVSLQKLLHDGDVALNLPIEPGDEVYVPSPNLFAVHVVDKPGDVQLREGDDLAMAVARAGTSTNSNPDLNRIVVTRTVDGKSTVTNVNLYEVLKNGDRSKDVVMQKGDLVYVPTNPKKPGSSTFGDIFGVLRSLIFL